MNRRTILKGSAAAVATAVPLTTALPASAHERAEYHLQGLIEAMTELAKAKNAGAFRFGLGSPWGPEPYLQGVGGDGCFSGFELKKFRDGQPLYIEKEFCRFYHTGGKIVFPD